MTVMFEKAEQYMRQNIHSMLDLSLYSLDLYCLTNSVCSETLFLIIIITFGESCCIIATLTLGLQYFGIDASYFNETPFCYLGV